MPPSVRVEWCPSRPNQAGRSGAMNEFMKSLATCLWHVSRGQHHRVPGGFRPLMVTVVAQSFSPIRPLVRPAALSTDFCKGLRDRT